MSGTIGISVFSGSKLSSVTSYSHAAAGLDAACLRMFRPIGNPNEVENGDLSEVGLFVN